MVMLNVELVVAVAVVIVAIRSARWWCLGGMGGEGDIIGFYTVFYLLADAGLFREPPP
jgi:hypothetical protein